MSDVSPNIISAAFKSLPASLLSPFEATLDGGGFGSGLFSSLLSEMSAAEQPVTSSVPVTNTPNVVTPINLSVSSTQTTIPYPDTTALRQVLQYIRAHGATQQSPQTSQGNTNNVNNSAAQSGTSSNVTPAMSSNAATGATTAATQTASSAAASGDNANTSSGASASGNDPSQPPDAQTIAGALLEFQQLVQWVAQHLSSSAPDGKLMASISAVLSSLSVSSASISSASAPSASAPSAPATAATGATQTTAATSDASTSSSSATDAAASGDASLLADALVAFLALVQNAGALSATPAATNNALATASTADAANTAASDIVLTPANPSPYGQIKATLQKLEAAIVANAANNSQTSDDANAKAASTADTASAAIAVFSPSSSSSSKTSGALTPDALLPEINLSAPTAANNLVRMLSDIFGNANTAAASATVNSLPVATNGDGAGSSFASDNGQGGSNGSSAPDTPAILTANDDPAPLLTNGVQAAVNPFSFASQLSATHATSSSAVSASVPSVLDQVILSLSRGAKNGDSQMSIQLQPADLGRINIKLDLSSDGKVQGTVVADSPATLDHLLKDVRSLERALQEAGLRADPGSLQFSLGGQQQPGNTFGQASNDGSSGGASTDTNSSAVPTSVADAVSIPADTEIYYITPGGVNIKV